MSSSTSTSVSQFIESLEPTDRIIHNLAEKMLKTRYDPRRTNAYNVWLKKQEDKEKTITMPEHRS